MPNISTSPHLMDQVVLDLESKLNDKLNAHTIVNHLLLVASSMIAYYGEKYKFILKNDDKEILNTDGSGNLLKVIKSIYGTDVAKKMIEINASNDDYDIIILTKSTKDRVSIYSSLKSIHSLYGEVNINKIGVINIPHETYKLKDNEFKWLKNKLSEKGIIVSLMDNDRTGKLEAIYLKKEYNILPLINKKIKITFNNKCHLYHLHKYSI